MASVPTSRRRQPIHRRPHSPIDPPRDDRPRWDIGDRRCTDHVSVPHRERLAIPGRHSVVRLAAAPFAAPSVARDLLQTLRRPPQVETHVTNPSLSMPFGRCDQRAFFASCKCSYERERRRQRTSCATGVHQRGQLSQQPPIRKRDTCGLWTKGRGSPWMTSR
jgi:hypothetical protein